MRALLLVVLAIDCATSNRTVLRVCCRSTAANPVTVGCRRRARSPFHQPPRRMKFASSRVRPRVAQIMHPIQPIMVQPVSRLTKTSRAIESIWRDIPMIAGRKYAPSSTSPNTCSTIAAMLRGSREIATMRPDGALAGTPPGLTPGKDPRCPRLRTLLARPRHAVAGTGRR
jgi:hypothetical protein